jgi:hypothetical protein
MIIMLNLRLKLLSVCSSLEIFDNFFHRFHNFAKRQASDLQQFWVYKRSVSKGCTTSLIAIGYHLISNSGNCGKDGCSVE